MSSFSLPPSALKLLAGLEAELAEPEKPIRAARITQLNPFVVRRALSAARRNAAPGQVAAAVYAPPNRAESGLVIVGVDDLDELLRRLSEAELAKNEAEREERG